MKYFNNVLETIGNTPLIRLRRSVEGVPALVLAKVETFNPGHSIKDRMAVKMVDDAERSGKLRPGGTIIECTSGNTGMGLALVACVRGYKSIFTTSDKQSKEKIDMLKAMGADVIVCPTNVSPEDPRSYYSVARKLSEEIPNSFWCNQYDNLSNAQAHYLSTGPEIWQQTDGRITHLVVGVGTGGTISGVARYLKERNPKIQIWGIDTYGSVFKKYKETGIFDEKEIYPYITEGIGEDILPKNVDFSLIDSFEKVSDQDGALAARRLAREEGLLLGYSAGSALAGLHQLRDRLNADDVVVLIFHDHGSRYIGKIYNDDWMMERGFLRKDRTVADLLRSKIDKTFYSVAPGERIRNALAMMKQHDISQIPVLAGNEIIGTVAENSLLNFILEDPQQHPEMPVSDILSEPMPLVSLDMPMSTLNKYFTERCPGVIARDETGQYHVVTKYDIIRAL
ncbi:MAG: pyridoxal-phosphate dependent enzyme [Saprospiraceae bacterium]|jgi:cystathionine beta-synthase|nr:pyridoxal-phosphate dependent enzyme [Saprospiraceae bacterium]MBP9208839.1 pyridoxal-phosphate dependent enzyme [Saprospiraceae bacterium]MBV6472023.1 putative cystathionine beta-synthase [Saprospiraceae bacterium]